jgi:hypothetical protein
MLQTRFIHSSMAVEFSRILPCSTTRRGTAERDGFLLSSAMAHTETAPVALGLSVQWQP